MVLNASGSSLASRIGWLAAGVAIAAYAVRRSRRVGFRDKTVLISGASRGLGLELARAFAEEGADLVLLARDTARLHEAARELSARGADVLAVGCDIRIRDEVRHRIAEILRQKRAIDVLVNNAGVIQVAPLEHMKIGDYEESMRVHFWGPLYLIEEILPHMRRRKQGRIVNVASIGGKVAVPHLAPYVASKFALVGLSEAMRVELIKEGIYVTTVCPGLMRTGSHINAQFKGSHEKEFARFSTAAASPLLSISSARAARRIVEACRYGRAQVVITPQARALDLASSLFPGLVLEALGLVARLLPGPRGAEGNLPKRGWQSRSALSPSLLTRAADRAIEPNRQRPLA
jgi:short-subunit dehydrogenase